MAGIVQGREGGQAGRKKQYLVYYTDSTAGEKKPSFPIYKLSLGCGAVNFRLRAEENWSGVTLSVRQSRGKGSRLSAKWQLAWKGRGASWAFVKNRRQKSVAGLIQEKKQRNNKQAGIWIF